MEVRVIAAQHQDAQENGSLNGDILLLARLIFSGSNRSGTGGPDGELANHPGHQLESASGVSSQPDAAWGPRDNIALGYIRDSQHGNTIFKFARYQTALERSYYRAVHEFERLRCASPNPVTTKN